MDPGTDSDSDSEPTPEEIATKRLRMYLEPVTDDTEVRPYTSSDDEKALAMLRNEWKLIQGYIQTLLFDLKKNKAEYRRPGSILTKYLQSLGYKNPWVARPDGTPDKIYSEERRVPGEDGPRRFEMDKSVLKFAGVPLRRLPWQHQAGGAHSEVVMKRLLLVDIVKDAMGVSGMRERRKLNDYLEGYGHTVRQIEALQGMLDQTSENAVVECALSIVRAVVQSNDGKHLALRGGADSSSERARGVFRVVRLALSIALNTFTETDGPQNFVRGDLIPAYRRARVLHVSAFINANEYLAMWTDVMNLEGWVPCRDIQVKFLEIDASRLGANALRWTEDGKGSLNPVAPYTEREGIPVDSYTPHEGIPTTHQFGEGASLDNSQSDHEIDRALEQRAKEHQAVLVRLRESIAKLERMALSGNSFD